MMERLAGKLTYSNVVSTLCLFVLLGGGAYAAANLPKNSVGAKQLKKNAVTNAKIKADAVTGAEVADGSLGGADIAASTLGMVPRAETAASAGSASTAAFADNAAIAAKAVKAADSDRLAGRQIGAFRDSCWFTQEQVAFDVCASEEDVATDESWEEALESCADDGRRLPDISEAYLMATYPASLSLPEDQLYWTDQFWTDEGEPMALAVSWSAAEGTSLEIQDATEELGVRCVGVPTNSLALAPKPQPAG